MWNKKQRIDLQEELKQCRLQINRFLIQIGYLVTADKPEKTFKWHLDAREKELTSKAERDRIIGIIIDVVKKGSLKEEK